MTKDAWKRRLGDSAWSYITNLKLKTLEEEGLEEVAAELLTRLYEAGWRGPEVAPVIDPRGTKVLWQNGLQRTAVLTTEGLLRYWEGKGHHWVLLRVNQLCKATAGALAPRLQEVLHAYETQCEADNVEALPSWADWRVFVGGEQPVIDAATLHEKLKNGE